MGSILSKIDDDYDDYLILCKDLGLIPKINAFYEHQKEILNHLGFSSLYQFRESERKKKLRDSKINDILI